MTSIAFKPMTLSVASTDTFTWANTNGGFWGIASNWEDTTAGAVATGAPGVSSTVSIIGGIGDAFTNVNGVGAAGQLSIAQDVLFWGSVTVGGTLALVALPSVSTELDMDGGASLTAGNVTLAGRTTLEVTDGSTLQANGGATLTDGFLLAASRGSVQFGTLIANGFAGSYGPLYGTIAVDDTGAIEVGTLGGAAAGAITVDAGQSAAVSGTIDGNVVLNGTLAVQAGGSLTIDAADPFGSAQSISGGGTLTINENSQVALGVADSAAIRFAGPAGTLILHALPSGIISGFAAGDILEIPAGLATGVSYTQANAGTATLTLTKGASVVGTLTLAGNYAGSQLHMRLDAAGDAFISLQTTGSAAAQPGTIGGTAGSDTLIATANNQTLTGYGGDDFLSGGGFTGTDFKDTSADLSGSTIASFVASDTIDLTDMKLATASVTYTPPVYSPTANPVPATLVMTDGTHTATVTLSATTSLPFGSWSVSSDGAAGTDVKYASINTDADTFLPSLGGQLGLVTNWEDTTTAAAATVGPSYGNAVTVAGGASYTDLLGIGFGASLTSSGDVLLLGTLNVGAVVTGVSGALVQTGTLALDGGAHLTLSGSASIGGLIEVGDDGKLTAAGSASFTSTEAALLAMDGSVLQFGSIITSGNGLFAPSLIGVDGNSSIEFGTTGSARAGAVTIDNGVTASLDGTVEGNVVVNGTLSISGQSLAIAGFGPVTPSVSGTGTLAINSGGVLTLTGSDSTAIQFGTGSVGTLSLGSILPTGTISGFGPGDAITLGQPVTTLRYSKTGSTGTLTLYDGSATVGTLLLAGTYTALQFQVQLSADGSSSTITYAATPNATSGTQVSSGSDAYSWTDISGGVWSNAGNWTDTTTGKAATTAAGARDAVVIQDTPGSATSQIISGSGAAASLAIYSPASTVFTGTIVVAGALWVGADAGGGVTLENGAGFTVQTLDDYGSLQLEGATLAVTGSAIGTEMVGTLNVVDAGSMVVNGGADIDGGAIGVDATSSLEFGSAGGAASGAVTIDIGQTVSDEENATIASRLVVNGLLVVDAATVEGFGGSVGSIGGTGTIQVGNAAGSGALTLYASDSAALSLYQGGAPESIEVQGPLPTGVISGFAAGDTIRIDQVVTAIVFSQSTATEGALFLLNGSSLVGVLTFFGNYAAGRFQVTSAGSTGFATISLLPVASSTGGSAANTSFDAYSWIGGSSGNWGSGANWEDITTGTTPGTVPGSNTNPVSIAGNTVIGGTGAAGNVMVSGNLTLTGQLIVSWTTTVGSASGQSANLAVSGGGVLVTAYIVVAGSWEVGGGSVAAVYYSATLENATLVVGGGSTLLAVTLADSGSGDVVAVDADSIMRVGYAATGTAGALTIGSGTITALVGSIYGNLIVSGALQTTGGGTLFIDMTGTGESDPYSNTPTVGGSGQIWLAEGSTLGLGAADSAAIQFGGPNATLVLATAAATSATISGFSAGDMIQIDQPVTGLSYQSLTGSLTLTDGAYSVGVLKLAGNYGGDAFHVDPGPTSGTATITLQTLGIAATQPTLIQGTSGNDVLTATANGQTLTGGGGTDTLNAGGFGSLVFKDATALMNYYTVTGFNTSDVLDFTDLNPNTAWVTYTPSVSIITVSDGAHAANMHLSFTTLPTSGSFSISADGTGGSRVVWT
jgi:hypothetical protein